MNTFSGLNQIYVYQKRVEWKGEKKTSEFQKEKTDADPEKVEKMTS